MVTTWLPGVDYQQQEIVQLHSILYSATESHRSRGESQPPNPMWVEVPNEPELKHKSSQYIRQFDHLKPEVNLLPKALGYSYALGPKNQIVEQPKDGSKRSHFFQKLENKLGSNQILSEGIMAAGKLVGAEVEPKEPSMFKPFLSEELWLSDARLRTEHYNQLVKSGSPLPSVEWVLVESGAPIPDNAIQCGHEKHGQRQFACRAFIKNGVHCGKYCEGGKPLIGHGNKEVSPAVFEILVGFPLAVEWIDCSESLSHCDSVYKGHHLIIGGNDGDKPFYVGQSHHEKGVHIGKVSDKMLLPFGNREHVKKSFRVLAYH